MPENLCDPAAIRRVLTAHGFRFDKRMGQNFLIDDKVPAQMAGLFSREQAVLEIGPGFGALTAALARTCGHVIAVEKDRRLLPLLRDNLSGCQNVALVEGDALRLDLAALMPDGFAGYAVCSNLPYSVTTPLLTRLLDARFFDPVVVMVQKEVAQRLTARHATPDYGAVTVYTAYHAKCTVLFDVPPDCFYPRPAVTSSVIRFNRLTPDPERDKLAPTALRLVKAAFAQRRKTLQNALSAGLALPRETVSASLAQAGIDPSVRGETLSPEQYIEMARFFPLQR